MTVPAEAEPLIQNKVLTQQFGLDMDFGFRFIPLSLELSMLALYIIVVCRDDWDTSKKSTSTSQFFIYQVTCLDIMLIHTILILMFRWTTDITMQFWLATWNIVELLVNIKDIL